MSRESGGTRLVELATDEDTAAACPSCGVFSTSVKERVTTRPKDIPYGEDRILLRWSKTRWRCREDFCTRTSFTEAIEQIPARARTTGRLRTQIGTAIGDAARSVSEVATAHGVSWPTAHRAFVEHADHLLAEPTPVRVLGIDESPEDFVQGGTPTDAGSPGGSTARTSRGGYGSIRGTPASSTSTVTRGCWGRRRGAPPRRSSSGCVRAPREFRDAIEYVAIDPAAVYAAAIRTEGLLPNATLVVDHFHLVKLANDTVTKVRRRVTWELEDRRGGKIEPSVGQPTSVAHRTGTTLEQELRDDVERDRERGPDRSKFVRIHREGGTLHVALHRQGRWRSAPDPASGCTGSSPGASTRTSQSSSPWRRRSTRGGRRSMRSSPPGSPMHGPRAATGS